MRLVLVDDERLLLAMATRGLRARRPDWVVETACNGHEAMVLLTSGKVDILVTDVQMPGMDGMALLAQVRRDPRLARLPLILISARDDRSSLREGMAAGADDYLTKPFTADELILAVEGRLRRLEASTEPSPQEASLRERLEETLTERERDVLALIAQGRVTKDIAVDLGVSPKTVSVHRQNIMDKLGLHNGAALAALAIRAGLA